MIRVLIADDSELTRVVICDLLSQDSGIEVIAQVSNGKAAVEQTCLLKPDLVIMDVMMPVMGGLEAVAKIMASQPTPILMLSASVDVQDSGGAFGAIRLGALDVMCKPSGIVTEAFSTISAKLIAKVKSLSRIRVMHHYRNPRIQPKQQKQPPAKLPGGSRRILAIGASTGGPKAVLQLLQQLPANFPAAILIVQHIADGFAAGFAEWLNRETALTVQIAAEGTLLQKGLVQISPTRCHLKVKGNQLVLDHSPPRHNCRPSVDVLFQSLTDQNLAAETVAVLLTGMGTDGAIGLAEMRQQGAHTIAQDEASCAVFGMPKAAIEREAAAQVLPLDQISGVLSRLFV